MALLEERRKALEELFFQKQNAKNLERLREQKRAKEAKQALGDVSGITNDELLQALLDAGLSAETLAAVSLIPLVVVAWADGEVQANEQTTIMKAAEEAGIHSGTEPHALLSDWLTQQPTEDLMSTWKVYMMELLETLSDAQRKVFAEKLIARSTAVAQAAGGFLGIAAIDGNEKRVLAEIRAALRSA